MISNCYRSQPAIETYKFVTSSIRSQIFREKLCIKNTKIMTRYTALFKQYT